MFTRPLPTALLLTVAVSLSACAKNSDAPSAPPVTTEPAAAEAEDKDPEKAMVNVSPQILELCGIDSAESNFKFNSSSLSREAKRTLDAVAECFLTGPAKEHNMNVVGHADPRGTDDYNFALGQRRAGSVGKYFRGKGLGDERVASSSRGELDASGGDEGGWARDRRVDLLLAE